MVNRCRFSAEKKTSPFFRLIFFYAVFLGLHLILKITSQNSPSENFKSPELFRNIGLGPVLTINLACTTMIINYNTNTTWKPGKTVHLNVGL